MIGGRPKTRGQNSLKRFLVSSMSGDAAGRAAVLVTSLIAARGADSRMFGSFIGLSAAYVVAAGIWDAGASTLITKELAADALSLRAAFAQLCRMRAVLSPVWIATYVGAVALVGEHWTGSASLLFGVASLFFASSAPVLAALRARLRFSAVALSMASGRWAAAVLALIFVKSHTASPISELGLALMIGELITLVLSVSALCSAPTGVRRSQPERRMINIRASLPLGLNGLLALVYNRFDVLLVPALAAAGQLAVYAPASRIQDALYLIPFALGAVGLPLMAKMCDPEELNRIVNRLMLRGLLCVIPIVVVGEFLMPTLLRGALGPGYASASTPSRILICFLPFAIVQAPLIAALIAVGRARDTTLIYGATFITALAMHIILDPQFGAVGGAIATLSRDIAAVPVAVVLARRAGIFRLSAKATTLPGEVSLG